MFFAIEILLSEGNVFVPPISLGAIDNFNPIKGLYGDI
jgi:hypothetical protein